MRLNGFLLVHASMSFPAFCSWVALCFSNVFFFPCVFTCTSSRTERWRFALGKWSESQNSWREIGLNLSTICAFSFLSCSCFLPFAFYLESFFFFFFWTCPLERKTTSWESTCMCLENCERIHFTCNKSSNTRDKGGEDGMQLYLMVSCFFITLSFPWRIMKREWKKKKSVKCFGSKVAYLVGTSIYCPYRAQWRNLISVTLAFSCAVVRKANKEASKDTSLSGLRRHFTCLGSKLSFMNEVEVPSGKFLHCVNDYWLGKSSMAVETARSSLLTWAK